MSGAEQLTGVQRLRQALSPYAPSDEARQAFEQDVSDRALEPNYPGDARNDFLSLVSTVEFDYPITPKFGFDVRYRYHNKGFDEGQDQVDDFSKNQVAGRFRYRPTATRKTSRRRQV